MGMMRRRPWAVCPSSIGVATFTAIVARWLSWGVSSAVTVATLATAVPGLAAHFVTSDGGFSSLTLSTTSQQTRPEAPPGCRAFRKQGDKAMAPTVTDVTVQFDVPCTLSDGTVLRANVFSPATDDAVPVLLLRHPYSKDNPFTMSHMQVMPVVRAGYIVAIVDVRGRFASEGVFNPTAQEADDGAEVVRWASRLPGSSGVVGGWGASYGAETQWSALLGGASELRTIVSVNSPSHNHFRGFVMRGGAHEFGSRLGWSHSSIALEELRREDPSPEGFRRAL